jgi:hypothetical protein
MKIRAAKIFLACAVAIGSWFLIQPVEAQVTTVAVVSPPVHRIHRHPHYHNRVVCRTHPGFWRHGLWYPPRRVCWRRW